MTTTAGTEVVWCECAGCHAPMLARLPAGCDLSRVYCRPCADTIRKAS